MTALINWLKPYQWLLEIAGTFVAIGAVIWAWSSFIDHERQIGYDKAAGEYGRQLAEQKEAALVIERGLNAKLKGAQDDRAETEKQLALARAAAATADDGLRRAAADFRQRLSAASVEACRAAAATAAGLLSECSSRYREVAAAAAGHAADVRQCEAAWPG